MRLTLEPSNGKTYIQRLTKFYSFIYHKRYGEYPHIDYMLFGRFFKRAFEKYGEVKLAAAILVHFEQHGDRIEQVRFPLSWVPRNIDKYLDQLTNKYGIDCTNDDELYRAIKSRMEYLDIRYEL